MANAHELNFRTLVQAARAGDLVLVCATEQGRPGIRRALVCAATAGADGARTLTPLAAMVAGDPAATYTPQGIIMESPQ